MLNLFRSRRMLSEDALQKHLCSASILKFYNINFQHTDPVDMFLQEAQIQSFKFGQHLIFGIPSVLFLNWEAILQCISVVTSWTETIDSPKGKNE